MLTTINVQSQNYFERYNRINQSINSTNYYNSRISTDSLITLARKKKKILEAYKISHSFSLVCYKQKKIKDALKYAELAVRIKKNTNQYDKDYVDSLYRVGFFASHIYDYKLAFVSYQEIINLNINPLKIALAYYSIGKNYLELNDYYKSISYLNKSIIKFKELNSNKNLLNAYENLSRAYIEINTEASLKSNLNILQKANKLEQSIDVKLSYRLQINNSFVSLYSSKTYYDFNKAKYYLNENLNLSKKHNQKDILPIIYNNLANIYNLEEKDSALYYANLGVLKSLNKESLALSYFQKSDYFKNKGSYEDALENIQLSINTIINKKIDYNSSLTFENISNNNDKDQLLLMLIHKIKLIYLSALKTQDKTMLQLALKHIMVSDLLIDDIQQKTLKETKLHWRTKASEIYTLGIDICYKLNDIETGFYLSEKGKALLLTEDILINNSFTKLPDSINLKEKALKNAIITQNKLGVKDKIFDAKLDYERYIESIKTGFPKYFKNQSLQKVISLSRLQSQLNDNSLIISYMYPDEENELSQIFALFITNNSIDLKPISEKKKLSQLLNKYSELINKPLNKVSEKESFKNTSNLLYKVLIPQNHSKYKQITVLADGPLHNIPFEALITDFESSKYLIEDSAISYAYSMSFLEYNSSLKRNTKDNLLAFAPSNFENLKLEPLKSSVSEVKSIKNIIGGDLFIEDLGSTLIFEKYSENSKIIHLATHAESGENPWIAFSDKKMSLEELYNTKNNAELTVLSSCESSIGEIATGEGVMSLARGFFYSGSNSVVASLWNVNDKSTSILMEDFYKGLKAGETKSEALRNAKLKYLKSASLSEASPYYWSSFILLGNTDKVEFKTNYNKENYYIVFIIILMSLIIYFFVIKKPE